MFELPRVGDIELVGIGNIAHDDGFIRIWVEKLGMHATDRVGRGCQTEGLRHAFHLGPKFCPVARRLFFGGEIVFLLRESW